MTRLTFYQRPKSTPKILVLFALSIALIFFLHHLSGSQLTHKYVLRSDNGYLNNYHTNTTHHLPIKRHRSLRPRADANPPTPYQLAIGKGCKYLAQLVSDTPPQTQFTDYSQLNRYGWERSTKAYFGIGDNVTPPVLQSVSLGGLDAPSNAQGTEGLNPAWVEWAHEELSTVTYDVGKRYNVSGHFSLSLAPELRLNTPQHASLILSFLQPTYAYYQTIYWPLQGIIIASNSLSPSASAAETKSGFEGGAIVPLAAWSDV